MTTSPELTRGMTQEMVAWFHEIEIVRNERLKRYIANRNKRTGQTWHVIRRYYTPGDMRGPYDRAIIANETGTQIRIYHLWYRKCWGKST